MAARKEDGKTRKQIQRRVNALRFLIKIAAGQMVDMEHAIGTDTWFETENGRVRALTYGFENGADNGTENGCENGLENGVKTGSETGTETGTEIETETGTEIETGKPVVTPLLVNIHGSGFTMGSAAMDDPFMMQFVEKCGVKVISIDYTLAPDERFPFALEQCYGILKYAKTHGDELQIDPDRIMIMGHSAGGNFCAAIGLKENENNLLGLKGIILDYPPTDIATDAYDKPRPKGALPPKLSRIFDAAYCLPEERTNPLVSPVYATEEMVDRFPPTMVITAGRDSLAAETERFKDTLLRAGVDVTFKRFEDAIHGFTIITEKQAKKHPEIYKMSLEAWQMMIDFVNKYI